MSDQQNLDAQIHEQVMGLTWDETRCGVCGWLLDSEEIDCTPESCSLRPVPVLRADTIPHYSTNLALAWLVVEHLREDDWWIEVSYARGHFVDDFNRPGYAVEFRDVILRRGEPTRVYGYAETLPEAICLAALKTVHIEGPHA